MNTSLLNRALWVSGAIMLTGCAAVEQQLKQHVKAPQVNFKAMAFGDVSSQAIGFKPTFTVTNTNLFSVPVNSASYQLTVNGQPMVNGNTDTIGQLAPNAPKDVTLDINLASESLSTLQQALFKDKKVDYQVSGDLNIMGLTVPFSQSSTLFVPEVSVSKVNVVKASMKEVQLMVSFAIDNKNDFTLPLQDLSYSVSTAAAPLISGNLANQKIGQGANVIELPLTLKTSQLVSNVLSLMKNPNVPLTVKIDSPMFNYQKTEQLNLSSLF
ncbi:LEA type 2 family protein [Psychrobium sp. 1_MG-2023]|uniref:NDR1/HIN1-like protein n=1 Tax=Psychrobium sp. 1_MG-2023 TaxID=3062624 RepID=UPI000C32C1A1|nr:LEA type 2 family protein [Psychrobium sp. 1_MG-2023]MDP2561493.1 LEA type 2 family protein [Psychrobium sp. 1_MG-2023]PKF57759.1 hypothetical protein CW748_06070 [Alteromonadales bacterium alter-6D02]